MVAKDLVAMGIILASRSLAFKFFKTATRWTLNSTSAASNNKEQPNVLNKPESSAVVESGNILREIT